VLLGKHLEGAVRPVTWITLSERAGTAAVPILISDRSHDVRAGPGVGHAVGSDEDGALVPTSRRRASGMNGTLTLQAGRWWILGAWSRRGKGFALYTAGSAQDTAQKWLFFLRVVNGNLSVPLARVFTGAACR